MTVIELDPRFPTAIPLEAASLLTGEVCYTEEVPIRVRWAIADAGGHSVSEADVLVTTDPENEDVQDRIAAGEKHFRVGLEEAPDPVRAPVPAAPTASAVEQEPAPSRLPETDDGGREAAAVLSDGTGIGAPVAGARTGDSAAGAYAQDPAAAADPGGSRSAGAELAGYPRLAEAIEVMAAARRGGEWEASQTHASLLPYLIEETFEYVDAVNEGVDIVGELSDLLLQVLFHAEVGDGFDIDDVAAAFVEKMRVRQPYLFDGSAADGGLVSVEEQERAWAEGRGGPRSQPAQFLPALALAEEAIRRAREAGVPDSEIPVELLCPTPGLELESGAEARTRAIARQFLADLERAEAAFAAQRDAGQGDGPVDGPVDGPGADGDADEWGADPGANQDEDEWGADGDEGWDRLPDDPAAGDEDDSPRT